MLKVEKLNKYYHSFGHKPLHVINDTTIEIPEKGIIAVIGESGAGKTTLINTISGLDNFKSGTISFDDVSVKHYRSSVADKIRIKNFGFIFQNYYLLEKSTVYENVKMALDSFDLSESEKKKRVNYVLSELGIARYTNKLVCNLSGGEQQRVSIARALVKSPRVIFADEPTGSLDEKTTFTVFNILKKVSKNCAVFIATHKRDIISYYADYIIELDKGVVVEQFVPKKAEGKSLAIDQNIYLSELEKVDSLANDKFSFDIYSDGSSTEKSKVTIAVKDNKIYLQSSDNIVFLDKNGEKHLVDSERYQIKDYVDDNSSFELEPIPYSSNKLSFKQTFIKGYQNYKKKSPIKNILKVIAMFLSMIFIVLLESANTIKYADLSNDLTSSRGNLCLEVLANGDGMNYDKLSLAYQTVLENVEKAAYQDEVRFQALDTMSFAYSGFHQIKGSAFNVPQHDYKHISSLNEKALVAGNMPSSPYEIVVDEYILEKLVNSTILSNMITNYSYFIGKEFSNAPRYSLTISGICRTQSPTIYGYDLVNFVRLDYNYRAKIVDIETYKSLYPNDPVANLPLLKGQCIKSTNYSLLSYSTNFETLAYFDSQEYDLIITKEDYATCRKLAAYGRNEMYIVSDGKEQTISFYRSLINETVKQLEDEHILVKINMTHRYQNEVDKATDVLNKISFYVRITAIVIIVIAFLMIVLSTYLSMSHQIGTISVYRMLGYSRFRLGLIYVIELLLLSLIYTFVGGGITFFGMFILDVIPLVAFTISTPIYQMLLVALSISLAIVLIGIIPVFIVFKSTPAQINARYAKKTNNE